MAHLAKGQITAAAPFDDALKRTVFGAGSHHVKNQTSHPGNWRDVSIDGGCGMVWHFAVAGDCDEPAK
jgi:hypothetical protein